MMASRSGAWTGSAAAPRATRSWRWALAWVEVALARRRQRVRLAALEPRLLRDIGITHAEALAESRKPFWRR